MSDKKIWFGTLYPSSLPGTATSTGNAKMSWVPAPDTGMEAGSYGYSQVLEYENGGASVIGSAGMHRRYEMDWNLREASGVDGLDIVKHYQQKLYGPGLIFWANPMNFDQNMFAPAFASPALCESGWESPGPVTTGTVFLPTAANTTNQPLRSMGFSIPAGTIDQPPTGANYIQVVPIPPTHVAYVGITAEATGSANVVIRPILHNGSYASPQYASIYAANSLTRMGAAGFSGATYKAIEVYYSRSHATSSASIRVISAMCQLWPIGYTPTLTGNHIPGQGDMGCRFTEAANVETFRMVDHTGTPRHYKGMSTSLTEVVRSAWA